MALNPWAQYPAKIAVAMRADKRNVRVMVFEVHTGTDATSPFGSSALCVHQSNVVESLAIKVHEELFGDLLAQAPRCSWDVCKQLDWFKQSDQRVALVEEVRCLQSMAWLGQQLVLCTSLRYVLLHPAQQSSTQLFSLAAEAPWPTLVQSLPAANLAVLLMVSLPLLLHPVPHSSCGCLVLSLTICKGLGA